MKDFSFRSLIRPSVIKGVALGFLRFALAPLGWGGGAIFVTVAASFYFVPFFRPRALLTQWVAVIVLAFLLPEGVLPAAALAAMFALLLGIKDLEFVERGIAYEVLAFVALFAGAMAAFRAAPHWAAGAGFWGALALAFLFYDFAAALPWQGWPREHRYPAALVVLGAALVFEVAMALLFLPVDFVSQASVLFLFAVFLAMVIGRFRSGDAERGLLIRVFGTLTLVAGVVLAVSRWSL